MEGKNITEVKIEATNEITQALNELLSNHQIYYQNLRGFHWLVVGKEFFHLHAKFEELYSEASNTIDEIAERILMLGDKPLHTFESYIENSTLSVVSNFRDANSMVDIVEKNIQLLTNQVRTVLSKASISGDEGTVNIMSELVSKYEKHLWMFSAYSQDN